MLQSMGLQMVTIGRRKELVVSSLVVQCVGVSDPTPKFQEDGIRSDQISC